MVHLEVKTTKTTSNFQPSTTHSKLWVITVIGKVLQKLLCTSYCSLLKITLSVLFHEDTITLDTVQKLEEIGIIDD